MDDTVDLVHHIWGVCLVTTMGIKSASRSSYMSQLSYKILCLSNKRGWRSNSVIQKSWIFMQDLKDKGPPRSWNLYTHADMSVYIVTVTQIHAKIGFVWRCVESIAECDQRQSIILKCDNQTLELVQSKACIFNYSHHLCLKALPHILVSVSWVAWKQWFGWETLGWALTCIDVWFPHLVKNMVLLLSCAHTIWIYSVEV